MVQLAMKNENINEMLKSIEKGEKVCYEKEEHFLVSLDICCKNIPSTWV
jgi:hypothetical protein